MKYRNRIASVLVSIAACAAVANTALAQPLVECPFKEHVGGDAYDRAFYVPDYPGDSLGVVLLFFNCESAGEHVFTLTARSGAYDGPLIGVATATASFGADHQTDAVVRFDFHGVPVATGSTATFAIDIISGPGDAFCYYDTGVQCDNQVVQTEDSTPPLSEYRRDHVGVTIFGGVSPVPMVYWIAVASHAPGTNQSQWRSDLSLLNRDKAEADVQVKLHIDGSVMVRSLTVGGGSQEIIRDVVAWIDSGVEGSGPLEVASDRPLEVDARTYTVVDSAAECMPDGTFGQVYNGHYSHRGLVKNETVILPGLSENGLFRCNIGFSNTGAKKAKVVLTLYDSDGTQLWQSGNISLASGKWKQENRPFFNKAGQNDIDEGYATVKVVQGAGVQVYASLIDEVTNDAATIWMKRP